MSYSRGEGWAEPSVPTEVFRPGTFLGSSALLFTSGRPTTPTRVREDGARENGARGNGDCWLLDLLGEDHCTRVLIAEGGAGC